MSNTSRNPERILRNDYQSLSSVRGKWFWVCVKTGLGSWWPMGISISCRCLSRGCRACAGSAVSSLLFCHPRHPAASCVAQSKGLCDSRPHVTTASTAGAAVVVMELVKCHLVFCPVASWLWLTCAVVGDAQSQVIKLFTIIAGLHLLLGGLFCWVRFSHYVQSKQGLCNDIAASAGSNAKFALWNPEKAQMWTFWEGCKWSGEHGMLSKWMANFCPSRVRRIHSHKTETQNYFRA